MSSDHDRKSKSATMTVRLTPELNEKLRALAHTTHRTKAYLAGEAIAAFVDVNAWQVGRIKRALDEAHAAAPGIPHDHVVDWMDSWGTEHELPRPAPKTR